MHNNTLIRSFILFLSIMLPLHSQAIFAKASDDVNIVKPYVRAVPPGQPNSAAFMQLVNTSKTVHSIVNATSDISKTVELHTHLNENGMMKMRRIKQISISSNGTTVLKPGGLHIMFINLHKGLKIGQQVNLSLEFADGSVKTITAPVQKIMMPGMMHGKMMKQH